MPMSAEDRYRYDPVFSQLVDMIYAGIVDHQFTPTEVRDAAMLAAMKYEMKYSRSLFPRPAQSGVEANFGSSDFIRRLTETNRRDGGPK